MRPVNGAIVRETVRIQIPRSALNGVRYLSLNVDGKFRAGVAVPEATGKPFRSSTVEANDKIVSILWDTKAPVADPKTPTILEGVEDGTHRIKLIAYTEKGTRIAEEELSLTINNRGNLVMPAQGIPLSYRFKIGDTSQFKQQTELEYIGERRDTGFDPNQLNLAGRGSGYRSQGAGAGGFSGGFSGEGGPPAGMSSSGPRGGSRGMGGPPSGFGGPPAGMSSSGPRGGSRGMGGPPSGFSGAGGMGRGMGSGRGMGADGGMGGGMMGGAMGGAFNPIPNQSGPFSVPVQLVRATYERTVEDSVSGSLAFMRDKVLKGTISSGNGAVARLEDIYDFKSRYRTVAPSGTVLDYAVASANSPGAYVALPIIDLGGQRRRIGDTWNTRAPILLEWATLDPPPLVNVRNTLETLEWQDGYQTARIKQTYDQRTTVPIFGGAGKINDAKVTMSRTIWFAYQAGKVVRVDTTTEVEGDAPSDILAAMVPQAGVGGGGAGFGATAGMMGGVGGGGFMGGGPPSGMMGSSMGAMMRGRGMGSSSGTMGSSSGMLGAGMGDEDGGMGGGFGGMQTGAVDAPKVPAKFRSHTIVTLSQPTRTR
jgi:hypothetical protein